MGKNNKELRKITKAIEFFSTLNHKHRREKIWPDLKNGSAEFYFFSLASQVFHTLSNMKEKKKWSHQELKTL